MSSRFTDRGEPMGYLRTGTVLVRCPRCAGRAAATGSRVSCTGCGYSKAGAAAAAPVERRRVHAGGRCQRCGQTVRRSGMRWRHLLPRALPVSCPGCREVTVMATTDSLGCDSSIARYRGLELWLQVQCRGRTLWALHEEHLDYLERYVAAGIRERVPNRNGSQASRLPVWIKSAKNRDEVVRCLARLRASLD